MGAAEISQLENGLTVLSVPGGTGSMTAMLFVGAGSRYETREVAGIAHFLEHLFFKGTPTRPTTLQIASEIDSLGCRFNAFTSAEYTAYFVKGAAEYATPAVDVIADMLKNAMLPSEEIERERGVVLEEMKMYEDNPQSKVRSLIGRVLFGDTPMGWDTIGFPEVIREVTRDAIVDYRQSFYLPGRMTLAIAGNVTHDLTQRLAEQHFAGLVAADLGQPVAASYAPIATEEAQRDIQQANICLALPGPSHRDPEREVIAARMMTAILGGSMSSRLFISVRERQGLCYTVNAGLDLASDVGALVIFTGTDPANAKKAVRSIIVELRALAADGPSDEEMDKARAMLKGRYVMDREDSMNQAYLAAAELHYRGRVTDRATQFEMIDSITADDVSRAARAYLRPEQLRAALVGPLGLRVEEIMDGAADAA